MVKKKIEKLSWEFRETDHIYFQSLVIVLEAYQKKINEIIERLNKVSNN